MTRSQGETLTEFVTRWLDSKFPRSTTRTAKPSETEYLFRTVQERDEFISMFPYRQCTDIPGVFKLGDGSMLTVLGLYVWLEDRP